MEIKFKGKWKWSGTFYGKKFKDCFNHAFDSLKWCFDGQMPDDYRIIIGEPK